MKAVLIGFAGSLALAGCATNRVTLHDHESGGDTGALAVLHPDGTETVIDQPHSRAALRRGKPGIRQLDGSDPNHAELLATLPPPLARFAITFPTGDARIQDAQRAVIDDIRAELDKRPGAQIEVAGFTDSTGDTGGNDALSKKRADAVADDLRRAGFEIYEEDAVGRGEYDAVARHGRGVPDESYRRVDVIIR